MSFRTPAEVPTDVCGTFYAAKVLGMAVATVQHLVERGELEATKTKGGHRRISMTSLRAYQAKHGGGRNVGKVLDAYSPYLKLLVVDDDQVALDLIRGAVESWGLPVDASYMKSAMEAMMDMSSLRPDVLVSDLRMPGVDGFEFLRTIRANPQFAGTLLLVVTALSDEEIAERGELPRYTHVIHKPLSMVWLQGFMTAMVRAKELIAERAL